MRRLGALESPKGVVGPLRPPSFDYVKILPKKAVKVQPSSLKLRIIRGGAWRDTIPLASG